LSAIPEEKIKRIKELVKAVNGITVSAFPECHEWLIQSRLMLVAGTAVKALGVFDLLRRGVDVKGDGHYEKLKGITW